MCAHIALLPTCFISHSKPPQPSLQLKAKKPNCLSSSSLFSRIKPILNCTTTQLSVSSSDDKILLFDNWPQLLQISIASGDLKLGHSIHGYLVKLGFQNDSFPGNNLINMYSKLNQIGSAQKVFDEMLDQNTITWTSLINGYSQINDADSVFGITFRMYRLQEEFNEHTWSIILRACESPDHRIQGEQIHCILIKNGLYEDVIVGTSLISMYSRSGYLEDVEKLYIDLSYKDVRCLNLMISEYGRAKNSKKAIQVFLELLRYGLEPTEYSFTNILSTCSEEREVEEGRQLHGLAVKYGFVCTTSVKNAIITMYGKHGLVEEAERMFNKMDERNLVSWTSILSVYVKNGHSEKTQNKFLQMVKLKMQPDSSCLATVLDSCSEGKNLALGLQLHGVAIKLGLLNHVNVGTALIDLYAKCGMLWSAKLVLNILGTNSSVASFNAILVGFSGTEEDAMILFNKLRLAGLTPDSITFARLLSLSANQACLVRGECLHALAIKTGFASDCTVGNALITMYAKCGSIHYADKVFNDMLSYDSISWNAMISANALHGQSEKAIWIFEEMIEEGFVPDGITVLGVLQACSYSCLLDYGFGLFNLMEIKYGIRPVIEHFACMVDLLGRAGLLAEAVDFINKCEFSDSPLLWRTLVHVCKLCGDLGFGKIAATNLLNLVPKESGSYILVSNMFAGGGMLDEASKVRTKMNDLKVSKEVGCSWIEINSKIHQFTAGGKDHPESKQIYAKLDLLEAEMKKTCDLLAYNNCVNGLYPI